MIRPSTVPAQSRGGLTTPVHAHQGHGARHDQIHNQYTLRAQNRDQLKTFLKESEIGTEVYYPLPIHLQACFKSLVYLKGHLPVSEGSASSVLSIPIYPELEVRNAIMLLKASGPFIPVEPVKK
jgi:dTDP-4-amino-4,6-dideoxygalactose transaminase